MFLPYRAKNLPEHIPYATYTLIGLNTLVYILTTRNGLEVRESAVQALAVSDATFSLGRLLSAMFLHSNLMHLAGNMLFLWIFGASLEGRLRPLKFVSLYLIAGLVGSLLDEVVVGMHNPNRFALGASGAIMGLAGAYLWIFPHSIICVMRLIFPFYFRLQEWKAQWVILYYVFLDFLNGIVFQSSDHVGHFAHLGGAAAGFLMVLALRVPRDEEYYSAAQASLATMRDPNILSVYELEALMDCPSPSIQVIQAYCLKRAVSTHPADMARCAEAIQKHARTLVEQGDASLLAKLVLQLPPAATQSLPLPFFLRLGSQLERMAVPDVATRLYYRILETNAQSPDAEAALFRLGRLAETVYRDEAQARHFYSEMLRQFPAGALTFDCQRALAHLPSPNLVPAPELS